MKIPTQYLIYLGAAVVIGIVFSFGMIAMFSQPAPMQVPLTTYQQPTPMFTAAPPPPPAIPTLTPQMIEGSTAEQAMKANRSNDPYAPASAPVIVTTAPLPTITPKPEITTAVVDECDPATNPDGAKGMACAQKNLAATVGAGIQIIGVMLLVIGFAILMHAMMGGGSSSLIGAVMMIIIGGVFMIIGFTVLNALTAALAASAIP